MNHGRRTVNEMHASDYQMYIPSNRCHVWTARATMAVAVPVALELHARITFWVACNPLVAILPTAVRARACRRGWRGSWRFALEKEVQDHLCRPPGAHGPLSHWPCYQSCCCSLARPAVRTLPGAVHDECRRDTSICLAVSTALACAAG